MVAITYPETMALQDPLSGEISWGANQEWYAEEWQRRAGCGPTAAASLIFYERQKQLIKEGKLALTVRQRLLELMEELWLVITPGHGGVNRTSMFEEGLTRWIKDHEHRWSAEVLNIPEYPADRPSLSRVSEFLEAALRQDHPLAFLNLCCGEETRLDEWHWVMVWAWNPESFEISFFDEGLQKTADLSLWLRTTTRRGGFVCLNMTEDPALRDDHRFPAKTGSL